MTAADQAFAWNPSITGTKTEDTALVDGDRLEVLTACSSSWPTIPVAARGTPTYKRPGILVR